MNDVGADTRGSMLLRQHHRGISGAPARDQDIQRFRRSGAGENMVFDLRDMTGRPGNQPIGFLRRVSRRIGVNLVLNAKVVVHLMLISIALRDSVPAVESRLMRGYFGIGIEGVSKAINVGNLVRSAHALGASFVFTVAANYDVATSQSDTSDTTTQVPFYPFDSIESMRLPDGCALVGIELNDRAIDLPSFRHPRRAAYVLGMERVGLSDAMIECCDHLIKIPTRFSLNLATAGGIVMYDRMLSMQRFADRPVMVGGRPQPLPEHEFGTPVIRRPAEKSEGRQ